MCIGSPLRNLCLSRSLRLDGVGTNRGEQENREFSQGYSPTTLTRLMVVPSSSYR